MLVDVGGDVVVDVVVCNRRTVVASYARVVSDTVGNVTDYGMDEKVYGSWFSFFSEDTHSLPLA